MDDLELDIGPDFFKDENTFNALPHVVDVLERQVDDNDHSRQNLENDLKTVEQLLNGKVDQHYATFGSSVKSFSEIFQEFTDAQNRIYNLKGHITSCKQTLKNRKHNLKLLWVRKQRTSKLIELIEKLESITSAPSRFKTLLSEKKYVSCVKEFLETYELSYGQDFCNLDSLNDHRNELLKWKQTISDVLLEELKSSLIDGCCLKASKEDLEDIERMNEDNAELESAIVLNDYTKDGIGEKSKEKRDFDLEERKGRLSEAIQALEMLKRLTTAVQTIRRELRQDVQNILNYHVQRTLIEQHEENEEESGAIRFGDQLGDQQGNHVPGGHSGLFVHTLQLKTTLIRILRDCTTYLTNHAVFIELSPETEAGYTISETWSAINVHIKQFLDTYLRPSTNTAHQKPLSSPQNTIRNRGKSDVERKSSAANHPKNSLSNFLFLDINTTETTPHGEHSIPQEQMVEIEPDQADEEELEYVFEVLEDVEHLIEADSYNLIPLVKPLKAFIARTEKIVHVRECQQLSNYIFEFYNQVLKPTVETDMLTSLNAVLKPECISEIILPSDQGDFGNSTHLFDHHIDLNKFGRSGIFHSFPSVLTIELIHSIGDILVYQNEMSDKKYSFEGLIEIIMQTFVRFCQAQFESVLEGKVVGLFLASDEFDIRKLSYEKDPILMLLQSQSSSSMQFASNESVLEYIEQEDIVFKSFFESLAPKDRGARSMMSQDGICILGALSSSLQWLLNKLVDGVAGIAHMVGISYNDVKNLEESSITKGIVNDIRTLQKDCLLALHFETRCVLEMQFQSLVNSNSNLDKNNGTKGDMTLGTTLANLCTQFVSISSVLLSVTPKPFLQYIFYSLKYSSASLVITEVGTNFQTIEPTILKSAIRNGYLLNQSLDDITGMNSSEPFAAVSIFINIISTPDQVDAIKQLEVVANSVPSQSIMVLKSIFKKAKGRSRKNVVMV